MVLWLCSAGSWSIAVSSQGLSAKGLSASSGTGGPFSTGPWSAADMHGVDVANGPATEDVQGVSWPDDRFAGPATTSGAVDAHVNAGKVSGGADRRTEARGQADGAVDDGGAVTAAGAEERLRLAIDEQHDRVVRGEQVGAGGSLHLGGVDHEGFLSGRGVTAPAGKRGAGGGATPRAAAGRGADRPLSRPPVGARFGGLTPHQRRQSGGPVASFLTALCCSGTAQHRTCPSAPAISARASAWRPKRSAAWLLSAGGNPGLAEAVRLLSSEVAARTTSRPALPGAGRRLPGRCSRPSCSRALHPRSHFP
ncbi:hypothetical protein QFZ68_005866 [Streptomyces sp. V1I6]|nr:hypothetical protein [Streptomyces sp. V1I6]